MKIELNGVAETLLIPTRVRAYETSRPDSLLQDPWAVNILKQLELDKSSKDKIFSGTLIGTIARTLLIDKKLKSFMQQNPSGIVVNLGCALDSRYNRMSLPSITWYDLDVEVSMSERKHFFQETDNYKMITASMFDYFWIDKIPKNKPIILVFEGVSMYFSEDKLKSFFDEILNQFKQVDIVFDVLPKISAKNSNKHPDVKKYNVRFKWGIDSAEELLDWDNRIEVVSEESYMVTDHLKRWPLMFRLVGWLPFVKRMGRVIHIKRQDE